MGQDLPSERQGGARQDHLPQPLRHRAGGRRIQAEARAGERQIQGDRRLGTLRRSEGAGKRPVCADLGRARVPHDRVRPVVHRRIRRLAPRGRLPRHQHRGFLRRRGLSGEPHRRGSGGHRHCGYLRLRRPGTQRGRERPAHQGHRGEHHVRHEPRHRERLLRRRRLGRQTQ